MGTHDDLFQPVKAGELHTVKVIGTGQKGDAMAKIKGLVVFINGKAKKGDEVKIKIVRVKDKVAFAEVVR